MSVWFYVETGDGGRIFWGYKETGCGKQDEEKGNGC
jgi:hypothetical protein